MAAKNLKVLLTGGGTGGHIYPAIVIAAEVKRAYPNSEFLFVGTKNGLESKVVPPLGYRLQYIDVRYFIRRLTFKNFVAVYKALTAVHEAKKIIRQFKPDVVVGTGGYVSGPVVMAATRLRIPTLIHEQNAFPGLTTRLLAKRVTHVAVSHAEALKRLKAKGSTTVTGHPVRREFYEGNSDYRRREGINDKDKLVIVVGGSGGALKLNQVALVAAPIILQDPKVILIHVTGSRYYDRFQKMRGQLGLKAGEEERYRIVPYLDDMPAAMKACDLLIARAGGMVHEITVTGCPAILVPSPNVTDNHQLHNARHLVEAGAAIVIEESQLSETKLEEEISGLMDEPNKLHEMALRAKAIGKPEAGSHLAKLIFEIAKK